MKGKFAVLKNQLLSGGGAASGVSGAIGSVSNVCHSLCVTVVSALAVFGITLNVLPLMFLQTYQLYFWLAALGFTLVSLYFFIQQGSQRARDRNLLIFNLGLLTFGIPFAQFADSMDLFRFTGGSIATAGVFLFVFGKRVKLVYRSVALPDNVSVETVQPPGESLPAVPYASTYKPFTFAFPKITLRSALFLIVIGSFLVNQYFFYRIGGFERIVSSASSPAASAMKSSSRMKLSLFDVALAKERMDKNNDGVCDVCGMPIEQCIDAGQLDCNMGGGNKKDAIGILGSQHIHADWKVYVDGEPVDFSGMSHMERMGSNLPVSSFIHVDSGAPAPEKTGDILHMHATNVPTWLFFRSVGMKLEKNSLTLADGQAFSNGNGKALKFYVNGQRVDDLANYVFRDLDKILVSYGPENDPSVAEQLASITTFAKDH